MLIKKVYAHFICFQAKDFLSHNTNIIFATMWKNIIFAYCLIHKMHSTGKILLHSERYNSSYLNKHFCKSHKFNFMIVLKAINFIIHDDQLHLAENTKKYISKQVCQIDYILLIVMSKLSWFLPLTIYDILLNCSSVIIIAKMISH